MGIDPLGSDWEKAMRTFRVKIFMDGADIEPMKAAYKAGKVQGFTTNPTLMRKSGIKDYAAFAKAAIAAIPDLPISFEVFSDDFASMEAEARVIMSWGGNTFVKIPITNTEGKSAAPLIRKLSAEGCSLNVTAIMTLDQVKSVTEAVHPDSRTIVSVFAGRIADAGVDPVPVMRQAKALLARLPKAELLWASPREILNLVQADDIGCDIITITPDILAKAPSLGKDLGVFSLETVKMFHSDAKAAGYRLI
jgi:transaldolase